MDIEKTNRLNQVKKFLEFSAMSLAMISSGFEDDTPSDKMKNEVMLNGVTVINTLIEEIDDNADSIDIDDLVDIRDRTSGLEVEDMLVNLCDKLIGHRSTIQMFSAMSMGEIVLRNMRKKGDDHGEEE